MARIKNKKKKKQKLKQLIANKAADGVIGKKEADKFIQRAEKLGFDPKTAKRQTKKFLRANEDIKLRGKAADSLGIKNNTFDGKTDTGDNEGDNTSGASVTTDSVFEDTIIKTKGLGPYDKLLGYDEDGKPRALTRKINKYEKFLGGETHKSKKYLKELRESATQRMKINPQAYGRKPLKTDFDKLSFAEKYDKNKTKTLRQLSTPLRKFLKKDDDDPLNNFNLNKKGQVKKLKFSERRMRKFVNNESDLFGDIREAAGGLGTDSSATGTDRVKNTLGRIKSRGATSNTAEVKSQLYTRPKLVRG